MRVEMRKIILDSTVKKREMTRVNHFLNKKSVSFWNVV